VAAVGVDEPSLCRIQHAIDRGHKLGVAQRLREQAVHGLDDVEELEVVAHLVRRAARKVAMMRADGTPLPETSAMAIRSESWERATKS